MDLHLNPYTPGAGAPPTALLGREKILQDADVALKRILAARHSKSFFLVGLRGVGKTVLLNIIKERAEILGYKTVYIEVPENKSLAELLVAQFRKTLLSLNRGLAATAAIGKALGVLKSFAKVVKVGYGEIEVGLDIEPEQGMADSGDLELDLPELMEAVAEAAASRQTGVALFIDEVQYLKEVEFGALIMAVHRINQRGLPMILIGAGLPQVIALAGNSKSYAERLFNYPRMGALNEADAREALTRPVALEGVSYTPEALDRIVADTEGYPYFLQEWGARVWDTAPVSPIQLADVFNASDKVTRFLDENFFRVRFDRLTPAEKRYLRAMAELGPGPHRSGDVADMLGVKVSLIAPQRASLIKKGMVFSPAHGDTSFTVPLFDQFMKRIMPEIER